MRLLVVEDDPVISEILQEGLTEAKYDVDLARDGDAGLQMALAGEYGAIVLDVMLPGRDGFQVCAALRARRNQTPVLMLTARDAVPDRVRGLEGGADDYLLKPFDFTELLARIRALLRRDKVHRTRTIQIADLEIDTVTSQVRRAGKEIHLTPREYQLLEALALNEGRTLTREMILERVWRDEASYSNTVDVHITFLRKKIDAGFSPKLIHTVHGKGYVLRAEGTS